LSRQEAYAIVQDASMRAWRERTPFKQLLAAHPEVQRVLSPVQLDELFDYTYYTRYVDDAFARIGLAGTGTK
ncbi:MAG TPA: adenylosuccinate lyase, partial [Dehalococcoidia bacterium]|nr:adenylosuccinate lyase [Dehalococcoidia bacterium]